MLGVGITVSPFHSLCTGGQWEVYFSGGKISRSVLHLFKKAFRGSSMKIFLHKHEFSATYVSQVLPNCQVSLSTAKIPHLFGNGVDGLIDWSTCRFSTKRKYCFFCFVFSCRRNLQNTKRWSTRWRWLKKVSDYLFICTNCRYSSSSFCTNISSPRRTPWGWIRWHPVLPLHHSWDPRREQQWWWETPHFLLEEDKKKPHKRTFPASPFQFISRP